LGGGQGTVERLACLLLCLLIPLVCSCEENGRMLTADPTKVSQRARKRGVPQLGTLGAGSVFSFLFAFFFEIFLVGNHYTEVQVVEKIYDKAAAAKMGIEFENQV